MDLLSIICYVLLVLVIFIILRTEYNNHICDNLKCKLVDWAKERSSNDKERYMNALDMHSRQSTWMRAVLVSALLAFIIYWWFTGGLPSFILFLPVMLFFFVTIYFLIVFYQHHQTVPINNDIKAYIYSSCKDEDQRSAKLRELGELQVPNNVAGQDRFQSSNST